MKRISFRTLPLLVAVWLGMGLCWSSAWAEYELEVKIIDTVASSGADDVLLPIYMTNVLDSVAGFALLLEIDHPELLSFNLTRTIIGTLTENWEFVSFSHPGNDSSRLRIVALAESGSPPATYGIPPQLGYTPLLMISVDVRDVLDTISNRTASIDINDDNIVNFGFSTPNGELIGTYVDSVRDTAYWHCLVWEEPDSTCTEWEWLEEPINPGDSFIVYWKQVEYLDPEAIILDPGSVTVSGGYKCGDVDGNGDEEPNISDLIAMVTYMFQEGTPPPALPALDANGDGAIDIADVIWMVSFMFSDGSPPICGS